MNWTTRTAPFALTALLACGGTGDTSATGTTSTSSTATTGSTAATTTAGITAGSTTDGGGSGTQGQTTSTTDSTSTSTSTSTTTTSGPDTSSTGGTTTSTTSSGTTDGTSGSGSTSSSSTGGSSTGNACSGQGESCANGEVCCQALECCAGVPVPPGKEFCSNNCPISDRNAKTEFRAVDVQDILARVVALDITTWRYKKDADGVRHLGPMAQDFKAAFGLWDTDRMIFPLDATGVSLAAIQGLHRRLVAAEAENDDLRARLDRLERRLGELEAP